MSDKKPNNVVPLRPKRREPGDGHCFVLCPCEPEGVPFVVVGLSADHPKIVGLVCPMCDQEVAVTDGIVEADRCGDF